MKSADKVLTCADCRETFVFSADEQPFFREKNFKHDAKRCKRCIAKRNMRIKLVYHEVIVRCAECGIETTVPFKPTQGRPVLCRECFDKKRRTA